MPDPIHLPPYGLRRYHDTGSVLVIEPMEPQPEPDWDDAQVADWLNGICVRCGGTGELEEGDGEYEEREGVCDECGGTGEQEDGKPPRRKPGSGGNDPLVEGPQVP